MCGILPVTQEVASSSLVGPAKLIIKDLAGFYGSPNWWPFLLRGNAVGNKTGLAGFRENPGFSGRFFL